MLVAIINFTLFFIVAIVIGGDAISGHEADGLYYVSNHGILSEVSYPTFLLSKFQVYSVWITHPLAMLLGIIYFITGGKKEDFWKFRR